MYNHQYLSSSNTFNTNNLSTSPPTTVKMKYFYTLAALAGLAAAQTLPSCAVGCIQTATESASDCTFGDLSCTCLESNRGPITDAATPCVIAECGVEVALSMLPPLLPLS